MALIGFLVLSTVGFGTFVNSAFFGTQNENIGVEGVKVEAQAGGQSNQ